MPLKQPAFGSRMDPQTELKAWRMTFKSGYDYLRALPKIGILLGKRHTPQRDLVEDAWRRLGCAFLDARNPKADLTWAERELGQPEDMPVSITTRRRR